MVIRVEVTVNGGSVRALSRNANMFDSKGDFLPVRKPPVIEGSRVTSFERECDSSDIVLSWNPLRDIDPPRDIVEKRAVAALLLSMRTAR